MTKDKDIFICYEISPAMKNTRVFLVGAEEEEKKSVSLVISVLGCLLFLCPFYIDISSAKED